MTRLLGRLRAPFFVAVAALLLAAPARAQGVMQMLGPSVNGHLAMLLGHAGQAFDAGGPTTKNGPPVNSLNPGTRPTGLGIVNSGLGNCQWSGYASAPYSELCSGFDGKGNGLITLDQIGGAPNPTLTFLINGVPYPFPTPGASPLNLSAIAYITDPQFGAKCDGVDGDGAAIQSAIRYGQANNVAVGFPSLSCVLDVPVTGTGQPITLIFNNTTLVQTHAGTGITLAQSSSGAKVTTWGNVTFVAADNSTQSAGALNIAFPPGIQSYPNLEMNGQVNVLSTQSTVTAPYPNTYKNGLTLLGDWEGTIYGFKFLGPQLASGEELGTSAILIPTGLACSGSFTVACYSSVGLGVYNLQAENVDIGLALQGYTEGTYLVEPQILGNWGVKVGNATVNGAGAYVGSSGITPLNGVYALVLRIIGGEFGTLRDSVFCDQCDSLDMVRTHFDPSSDGVNPTRNVTVVDSNSSDLNGNWTTGNATVAGTTNVLLATHNLGSGYNRIRGTVRLSQTGVTIQAGSIYNDTEINVTPGIIPIADSSSLNTDAFSQTGMKTFDNSIQVNGSVTGSENAYGATPVAAPTSWGLFDNIYGASELDIFNTSPAGNGTVIFGGMSALGGGKFQTGTIGSGGFTLPQAESFVGGRAVLGAPIQPSASASVANAGYNGFAIGEMSGYIPTTDVLTPVGGTGTEPTYLVATTQIANASVHAAGTGGTNSTYTTLAQPASPGQTVLAVASIAGFSSGQTIDVNMNGCAVTIPCFFETTISGAPSGGNITLAAGLPMAASVNNVIYVAQTVTGTTGTGTKGTVSVSIAGGAIGAILQVHGGSYTVNPTGCGIATCNEPVTGAGLSGSPTLTIQMGALGLTQQTAGSLTAPPSAVTTSSGAGTGAIITIAFAPGVGSDNLQTLWANGQEVIDALGDYTSTGYLSIAGHFIASGTAPALTSCGTSPAIVGDDKAGQITMGTGSPTGCVATFNAPYTSAPLCTVTWQATPLASQSYAVSTTAITLTQTATSSNKVNYDCHAQSGG